MRVAGLCLGESTVATAASTEPERGGVGTFSSELPFHDCEPDHLLQQSVAPQPSRADLYRCRLRDDRDEWSNNMYWCLAALDEEQPVHNSLQRSTKVGRLPTTVLPPTAHEQLPPDQGRVRQATDAPQTMNPGGGGVKPSQAPQSRKSREDADCNTNSPLRTRNQQTSPAQQVGHAQAHLTAHTATADTAGTATPNSGPRGQARNRFRKTSMPAPGAQPPQPPGVAAPFTVPVSINGRFAVALIDSGATGNMMSPLAASLYRVAVTKGAHDTAVTVADGSRHACGSVALDVPLRMGEQGRTMRGSESFFVPEMSLPSGFDIILGMPWIQKWRPLFDWEPPMSATISTCQGTVRLRNSSYRDPPVVAREGRAESKNLLTSILMLKQAQRAGDELMVAHVRPAAAADAPASALEGKEEAPAPAIQTVLDDMADVFAQLPDGLPPQREMDFELHLEPGSRIANQRAYPVPLRLRDECRRQITALLEKGFISKSISPWSAPILFVAKKSVGSGSTAVSGAPPERTWRMVCDFRALNYCTSKHAGPLPVVQELLNELSGATHFSCLDLQQGYNQIRIAPGDRHKTAFSTPFGHFEWNVLAFGLCNAPAVFQKLLNSVYADELGRFVVVYLDDILVYSKSEAEHVEHLRIVLQRLRDHRLFAKLSKCQFCKSSVEFLGHVVSADGIGMDRHKVQAVQDWPQPRTVKDIMQFVGLTNYYRKFVKSYASITVPLYELLKKDTPFVWGEQQQAAFAKLKAALTEAPLLMLPRPNAPYEMHTDASDFAIGAVLYQKDATSGELRPIAYESHKLSEVQRRYATHERELLAVVHALKVWRMYLVGGPVTVRTDHAALEWFNTQPKLSQRQARWSIAIQEHDVTFEYVPGRMNVVADALSRRPDLQAATVTFEIRKRTPTGQLVEADPLAPSQLPPVLPAARGGRGTPVTIAGSSAEPGTREGACDQEAPVASAAARIMTEFRRRQPRRACRDPAAHTGPGEAVLPGAAPGREGEMEEPAQPPRSTQPPDAAQEPSAANATKVEPPPLFDQILQAYRTHDFDPRISLQATLCYQMVFGASETETDRSGWSSPRMLNCKRTSCTNCTIPAPTHTWGSAELQSRSRAISGGLA